MQSVQEKYKNLQEYLKSLGSVAVAFSSGVDSTFLLAAAKETLGADHVIAVTASSCSFPKRELELTKQEIRDLSKEMGLPTWDKQSFACLSSRFVYGEEITESKLSMVDQAEQLLLDMGFHQLRVRIHGQMARIEVMPSEFLKLMEDANREKIVSEFKKIGFSYVTLDLQGYRMGSMNETIKTD